MTVLIKKGLFITWHFIVTRITCKEKKYPCSVSERHGLFYQLVGTSAG